MRTLAFATFLVWQLRTGAYGVGAYAFWRYRMPPDKTEEVRVLNIFEDRPMFSHIIQKVSARAFHSWIGL